MFTNLLLYLFFTNNPILLRRWTRLSLKVEGIAFFLEEASSLVTRQDSLSITWGHHCCHWEKWQISKQRKRQFYWFLSLKSGFLKLSYSQGDCDCQEQLWQRNCLGGKDCGETKPWCQWLPSKTFLLLSCRRCSWHQRLNNIFYLSADTSDKNCWCCVRTNH